MDRLRRIVVALLLVALLATGASAAMEAPPMYWTLFSTAASDAQGAGFRHCRIDPNVATGTTEIVVVRLVKAGDAHIYFYSPETYNIVWLYFKGDVEDASATAVGVGHVDPNAPDVIPTMEWMTYEEAKARYPGGPCDYLHPAKA